MLSKVRITSSYRPRNAGFATALTSRSGSMRCRKRTGFCLQTSQSTGSSSRKSCRAGRCQVHQRLYESSLRRSIRFGRFTREARILKPIGFSSSYNSLLPCARCAMATPTGAREAPTGSRQYHSRARPRCGRHAGTEAGLPPVVATGITDSNDLCRIANYLPCLHQKQGCTGLQDPAQPRLHTDSSRYSSPRYALRTVSFVNNALASSASTICPVWST